MSVLKKLFRKKEKANLEILKKYQSYKEKTLIDFYNEAIKECPYIKKNKVDKVLCDILGIKPINQGVELTKDEKKQLGLDPRLKITKQLRNVFKDKYLKNHKTILLSLKTKAQRKFLIHNDILRSQGLRIKRMEIKLTEEECCPWCKSLQGRIIPVSIIFMEEINMNYTCSSISIQINPIIDYRM